MIKFSIITVCLNAGNDLSKTILTTIQQTYKNFEIIIKDGMSTDGSVEVIPQDDRIKIIKKPDTGIYDAMNQGIDAATGDYLIFMNAGDYFYENQTLAQIADYITDPEVALYYGRCYNATLKVNSNSPKKLTPFFCYRSMICHQAMIFERSYLQKKKYDCRYQISADKEILLYTVVEKKLKTRYIPLIIAKYKGSGFSENENSKYKIQNELITLRYKYFTRNERIYNEFLLKLTLPNLRKRIVNNPKLIRIYKKLIGIIYKNR